MKSNKLPVFKIFIYLIFIYCMFWVVSNFSTLYDSYKNLSYKPTPEVELLMEKINLTEEGKFIFNASETNIYNRNEFNKNCVDKEITSAILGCYVFRKIYIYNVNNPQLNGIKEVTASHELLHAFWERFDNSKKEEISKLLDIEYSQQFNQKIKDRLDAYKDMGDFDFYNELFAIIGTETKNISPKLEEEYRKIFIDRSSITNMHQQYESIFINLNDESNRLLNEINVIKVEIEKKTEQYQNESESLNRDIEQFNIYANSDYFSDIEDFNNKRNSLIARSNQLRINIEQLNQDIDKYNQLVNQLNDINIKSENLNRSIDSKIEKPIEI